MISLSEYEILDEGIREKIKKLKQIALRRLGRRKPSGMFDKIAKKAAERYGSEEAGKRVAAAIYWKKVKAAQRAKKG